MTKCNRFALRRKSDDLVYLFEKLPGEAAFVRQDCPDLRIEFRKKFGWGAWSPDGKELQGRPWDVPLELQNENHPPQGLWVSQKGEKSYAYDLVLEKTEGERHVRSDR